jgi:MFS family permease
MDTDVRQLDAESTPERARFINPNFQRLWLASALSGLGDSIFELTLTVWIASKLADGKDWSALAVTGLLVASSIPILLVGPIAGALVDRWPDKRRVMQRADLISAALLLLLIPAAGVVKIPGLGHFPLWWRLAAIYVVVLLASVVAQFFRPSSWVMMRDVVPDEDRPRSSSYMQATRNAIMLIGPSLAPPLLFAVGAGPALLFNALTFTGSFFLVRAMRYEQPLHEAKEPSTPRTVLRDMGDGLRFFRNSQPLMVLAISFGIAMLGIGVMNTLDIFFVRDNLNTSAKYYGILIGVQSATMIGASLVWGRIMEKIGIARSMWIGMFCTSFSIFVYARMTSFEWALVLCALIGLFVPAINVAIGPILYRSTPREFMGRVSATLDPIISGSMLIGTMIGGVIYTAFMRNFNHTIAGIHFGPLDTLFLGVAVMMVVGAIYSLRLRVPDAEPETVKSPEPTGAVSQ